MIKILAKKEWFKAKTPGWGLQPVTMEGWLYIIISILIFVAVFNFPIDKYAKIIIGSIIVIVLLLDMIIVMIESHSSMSKQHQKHQLIVETTASYTAVAAVVMVALYQFTIEHNLNVGLIIVLGAIVLAKSIATLYLGKKKI